MLQKPQRDLIKALLSIEILKQVELALAYKCTDKIGNERLVQYIHYNRKANALSIDAMGKGEFGCSVI